MSNSINYPQHTPRHTRRPRLALSKPVGLCGAVGGVTGDLWKLLHEREVWSVWRACARVRPERRERACARERRENMPFRGVVCMFADNMRRKKRMMLMMMRMNICASTYVVYMYLNTYIVHKQTNIYRVSKRERETRFIGILAVANQFGNYAQTCSSRPAEQAVQNPHRVVHLTHTNTLDELNL